YYFYDEIKSEETSLHKNLKLDKMRLKRLKAMNGGRGELCWLQHEKEMNTVWPDEMIRLFSDTGYDAYTFNFAPEQMTYPQIWEYLKKQYRLYGYTWDYTLACWRDYLNMAEKLKIPLNIERNYKPKDVRLAHNEARDILQGKDIEEEAKKINRKWRKLNKVYPKLEKYEYSDTTYQIIAPKSTKDIVREGMILKHCVHTCDYYFQRMTSDETYILFLRKASEPNSPYYTLEVEPSGNIRQKRTTGDRQNKDFEEARRFLAKWQRAIQKRLTKEEKALGKKSNALRIKELKELRKNGNRVWHGVLQGQLLADVLEADFMPVTAAEAGKAV
ncbi:MAG: PcfJ domain-containing protein, partial [Lachnospiraceae bacterium]|nr:PcfJ domain-containing protein [Lachnospiraceae bacterium]